MDADALIRQISVDVQRIRSSAEELARHQAVTNGRLKDIEARQATTEIHTARMDGAVSFGRWLFAAVFILLGGGCSLAGVILTIILMQG